MSAAPPRLGSRLRRNLSRPDRWGTGRRPLNQCRVVDVGSLSLATLTEDNIAETGETLDGFDQELSDLGIDMSAITDQLKQAAARVAQNVAKANSVQLQKLGKKIAGNAIWTATRPFPEQVRVWLQPEFTPPDPTPKWITDITNPLLAPVIRGAQAEALRAAKKIKAPLYGTLAAIFLTIFGGGFILGRVTKGK